MWISSVKTDRAVKASAAIGAGGSCAADGTTPTAAAAASIRVVTPAIHAAFAPRPFVLNIAHSSLDGSRSPLVAHATRRANDARQRRQVRLRWPQANERDARLRRRRVLAHL